MPTVTAVVHTKNSERTLDLCLRSLSWCDEIFVVDMGSIDKTVAIAKKYGAKVFNEKSELTYADPVRNAYLSKVKSDWTLICDSDEEIPVALASKLKELMAQDGAAGYLLPRKNIVLGKWVEHTGYWPDYIVRFFRTGKATYPPQVHSQPLVDGRQEYLPADEKLAILHHHYNTIAEFIARMNTYTSLEVEKLTRAGKEFTPLEALTDFFAEFHRRYFMQKGYLDGSYGLALSLLSAVYQLTAYLKAWEVKKLETSVSTEDIEGEVQTACDATSYWVANEALNTNPPLFKRLQLKFTRKLHS